MQSTASQPGATPPPKRKKKADSQMVGAVVLVASVVGLPLLIGVGYLLMTTVFRDIAGWTSFGETLALVGKSPAQADQQLEQMRFDGLYYCYFFAFDADSRKQLTLLAARADMSAPELIRIRTEYVWGRKTTPEMIEMPVKVHLDQLKDKSHDEIVKLRWGTAGGRPYRPPLPEEKIERKEAIVTYKDNEQNPLGSYNYLLEDNVWRCQLPGDDYATYVALVEEKLQFKYLTPNEVHTASPDTIKNWRPEDIERFRNRFLLYRNYPAYYACHTEQSKLYFDELAKLLNLELNPMFDAMVNLDPKAAFDPNAFEPIAALGAALSIYPAAHTSGGPDTVTVKPISGPTVTQTYVGSRCQLKPSDVVPFERFAAKRGVNAQALTALRATLNPPKTDEETPE